MSASPTFSPPKTGGIEPSPPKKQSRASMSVPPAAPMPGSAPTSASGSWPILAPSRSGTTIFRVETGWASSTPEPT